MVKSNLITFDAPNYNLLITNLKVLDSFLTNTFTVREAQNVDLTNIYASNIFFFSIPQSMSSFIKADFVKE